MLPSLLPLWAVAFRTLVCFRTLLVVVVVSVASLGPVAPGPTLLLVFFHGGGACKHGRFAQGQ